VQGSYWELIFEQEAYFHGDAILCNFVALHNDFLFFIQAPSMLLIVFENRLIPLLIASSRFLLDDALISDVLAMLIIVNPHGFSAVE
jgi:hypothetical protein